MEDSHSDLHLGDRTPPDPRSECAVEIAEYQGSPKPIKSAISLEYAYAFAGVAAGIVLVVLGCVLFLYGIVGTSSWSARFLGMESDLIDAAPGAILFVVGIAVFWITRPRVRIRGTRVDEGWGTRVGEG